MSEEIERERAERLAEERFDVDYTGLVLNTLVSATSSITASGLLSTIESIPREELPLVFAVVFVAQVLPKLMVEANKRYQKTRAKIEGYQHGLLEDDEFGKGRSRTLRGRFLALCEHASYF